MDTFFRKNILEGEFLRGDEKINEINGNKIITLEIKNSVVKENEYIISGNNIYQKIGEVL